MTAGSIAGVLLVLAWSRIEGLVAFYALWIALGLVMAAVLYEPAFTVLAKHFPAPAERRRAMTAMTLVAALASFIFLPLTQALIDAHGWRDALVDPRRGPRRRHRAAARARPAQGAGGRAGARQATLERREGGAALAARSGCSPARSSSRRWPRSR